MCSSDLPGRLNRRRKGDIVAPGPRPNLFQVRQDILPLPLPLPPPLCVSQPPLSIALHLLHRPPRERLTADPPQKRVGKKTRTKTKLESERERDGRRGETLIMARLWLDMRWKVTADESSIIYSSTTLG